MTKNKDQSSQKDTALDMMKRVFAVAELIVRSDSYQTRNAQEQKKRPKTQN